MEIFHSKKNLCQCAHIPWNLIVSIGREYTADPVAWKIRKAKFQCCIIFFGPCLFATPDINVM